MSVKELIEKYGTREAVDINGVTIPVINIPMMSDEEWQKKAKECADKKKV